MGGITLRVLRLDLGLTLASSNCAAKTPYNESQAIDKLRKPAIVPHKELGYVIAWIGERVGLRTRRSHVRIVPGAPIS